jgi:hypothetical protein
MMNQCQAITAGGERCSRLVSESQSHCYAHDPNRAQERSEYASRAAKAKNSGSEIVQVKQQLRQLSDDVVNGAIPPGVGSVAGQLLGVFLKACEAERKQRETGELIARLDAVEAATQLRQRNQWRAR